MSPIIGSRGFGRWTVSSLDGAGPWWWGILSDTTPTPQMSGMDLATDNAGNAYYLAQNYSASYILEPKILKISNAGALTWVRRLYGSTWAQDQNKVHWTNGNLIASGVNGTGSSQWNYAIVLNADGTSTSTTRTMQVTTSTNYHMSIAMDSSSNIYNWGMYYTGSDYNNTLIRWNSNGTFSWGLYWYNYDNQSCIGWGGSNLYVNKYNNLYKINSSGTVVNSRQISPSPSPYYMGRKFSLDTSENSYRSGGNSNQSFIMKFDSDLLMTWGKTFSGFTGFSGYATGATTDASGNVYAWWIAMGQNKSMLVVKTNNAGTVLWQRSFAFRISGSYPYVYGGSLATYANGDIVLSVQTDTTTNRPQIIAKLPADGTKTGTYTTGSYSFDWTSESYTITSLSTPTYGSAQSPASQSVSVGSSVPSNAAFTNYTITKTDIPA